MCGLSGYLSDVRTGFNKFRTNRFHNKLKANFLFFRLKLFETSTNLGTKGLGSGFELSPPSPVELARRVCGGRAAQREHPVEAGRYY